MLTPSCRPSAGKAQVIKNLLDHAEKQALLAVLLDRAKASRSDRYTAHEPYWIEARPLELPPVATLPPGSRMPLAPNPLFVGRQADLQALAQALNEDYIAAIGQVAVTGLGGIGKTQLAVEFAHRYGPYFPSGVFWLSFANPDAVPAEIALCGGPGGLDLRSDFSALPLEDQVRLVQSAWHAPSPRLLIFDNCEDETLLARWRPTTGGFRVLVTSRRATWDPALAVQALSLGVLPRAESIALLRKFRPDLSEDDPDLNAIAVELGDLPLALHLAGSYLKENYPDIISAEYLAELQAETVLNHESLQGIDSTFSPTNHLLHVGRTFALSHDKLKPADPIDNLAMTLLARAAYFAAGQPIPRELLLATVELPDKAAHRRANQALKRLRALGLIEVEQEGTLVLHQLLAVFVQGLAKAECQTAVEETLLAEAQRINRVGYPVPLLA